MIRGRLDSQSVDYALEVISAINDLSIEAKLRVAGRVVDSERQDRAAKARTIVVRFLDRLGPVIAETARGEATTVVSDPQLTRLARDVLAERNQIPRAPQGVVDVEELRELIQSQDPGGRERLIADLRALRALLSNHIQPGLTELMGDV